VYEHGNNSRPNVLNGLMTSIFIDQDQHITTKQRKPVIMHWISLTHFLCIWPTFLQLFQVTSRLVRS